MVSLIFVRLTVKIGDVLMSCKCCASVSLRDVDLLGTPRVRTPATPTIIWWLGHNSAPSPPIFWSTYLLNFHYRGLISPCSYAIHKMLLSLPDTLPSHFPIKTIPSNPPHETPSEYPLDIPWTVPASPKCQLNIADFINANCRIYEYNI